MGINLDIARAARAAKREAKKKAPTVTFGGRHFTLPTELPFEVLQCMVALSKAQSNSDDAGAMTAIVATIRALLGDQHDAFMALRPSMEDLEALVNGAIPEYGIASPGESSASAGSSKSRSRPPKQTSKLPTA